MTTLRRHRRLLLPLTLGWLAACGGGDGRDGDAQRANTATAGTPAQAPAVDVAPRQAEAAPAPAAATSEPSVAAAPEAPAPSPATEATAPVAELAAATHAAAASTERHAWTPKTLDTGLDLGSIQVGSVAIQPAPPPVSNGRLVVVDGSAELDLGALVQGEVIHHTFLVENQGEGPVVLSGTHNSCGCTVSSTSRVAQDGTRAPFVYGETVAVGERVEIAIRVDTQGKKGAVTSTVTLQTDAAQPTYLQVRANVQPLLAITPETYITLPAMRSDGQQTTEFEVRSTTDQPFALQHERGAMPEYVQVELTPVDPDGEGRATRWTGKVVVGPGVPEGFNQGWPLYLVSDVPVAGKDGAVAEPGRTHRVNSYVVVSEVSGLVRVSPSHVSFGLVRPGATVSRTVRFESLDEAFALPADLPVRLAERAGANEDLVAQCVSTRVDVIEPGKVVEVTVTLSDVPDTYTGTLSGAIEVDIGHPTKPVATVLFSAVCRPTIQAPAGPMSPQ